MEREIKFRAWNGEVMYQMKALLLDSRKYPQLKDNKTIMMQFTGLKDKNGVDIYEGDIVDCLMGFEGSSLPHIGEIVYNERVGAFATKNEGGETLLHNHLLNTFEVVGNVYQNPEKRPY